jgi:isoleucyl-tRNA synthetase
VFEKTFPANYIIEGQDQTRGWFYHLMIMAVALFDRPAFSVVSVNGLVVDENKRKFSKSLHNYVDPSEQLEVYGADAVRLFILGSNFLKAEPVPVDKEGKVFNESIKTILTPLWNAYHFFTLYANAGNITARDVWGAPTHNALDEYILAETNVLIKTVDNALAEYKPDVAVKEVVRFLDVLNNWYIRRSRARFWDEDTDAFNTLYTVLVMVCRVLAPFAPFVSEYIYKNLTGAESVHLTDFPSAIETDNKIVADMRRVQEIVSVGKQLREQYKLRNRLPLNKLTVAGGTPMPDYTNIIRDELNVKSVEWVDNTAKVADSFIYLITPKIGARLGAALREIVPLVKNGDYELSGDKLIVGAHTLNSDEFENRLNIRDGITGMALPDNTSVVILDTELNSELIAEGLANDALRFIQDTRKALGLDVSDRINLTYTADLALSGAIEQHRKRIMSDALIREMSPGSAEHFTEIEGYNFGISIEKA